MSFRQVYKAVKVAANLPNKPVKVKMKLAILLCALTALSYGAPASQSMDLRDDGTYRFYYETGPEAGSQSRREEKGQDGVVRGEYSYEDPTGDVRVVNYQADDYGYVAKGDVGVAGAPPGQFPAAAEEQQKGQAVAETVDSEVEEKKEKETKEHKKADSSAEKDAVKKDENIKVTKLAPLQNFEYPDGFPEGFFLHNYHGLRRRLQDPSEEKVEGTEPEDKKKEDDKTEKSEKPAPETKIVPNFLPFLPFHNFAPQTWHAPVYHPSMLHQPVYVYSYQKPDSYGYSYFF